MKKIVMILFTAVMMFGIVPICVEAASTDKISEDLKKVMDLVDDEYQIDIILELKEEEKEEWFIEQYLSDGRPYSNFIALYFDATKDEILMYAQLEEVAEINTFRILPDKTIFNLGSTELSEERAAVIKDNYLGEKSLLLPEEVIIRYYGTFNECEVVNMSVTGELLPTVCGQVVIDNYYFDFGYQADADRFFVHKDGEFIHIKTAYEQGLLNKEDIDAIAKSFSGAYQIIDGKYFLVLQDKTEKEIKEAYLHNIKFENPYDKEVQNLTVDDLTIYDYYGTYEGRAVFTIGYKEYLPAVTTITRICGYPFTFNSLLYPDHFFTWGGDYLLTLEQTIESGWLSPDSINEIAQLRKMTISTSDFSDIYKDVNFNNDWFAWSAYKAYAMGLMTGLKADTFGAYENVSRAQFATILFRLANPGMDFEAYGGSENRYAGLFHDVSGDAWYAKEVAWAYDNDIVKGYENGNFGPADSITREQLAVMLYRYAESKGYFTIQSHNLKGFKDRGDISHYADAAIRWCVGNEIITGNNGYLKPQDYCTRAECAAMITRFAEKFVY